MLRRDAAEKDKRESPRQRAGEQMPAGPRREIWMLEQNRQRRAEDSEKAAGHEDGGDGDPAIVRARILQRRVVHPGRRQSGLALRSVDDSSAIAPFDFSRSMAA